MKYIKKLTTYGKMLGFYFFDFCGGALNFFCAVLGIYPCFDLGVRFLVAAEGGRINKEKTDQDSKKQKKVLDAEALKEKASTSSDG